MTLNAKDAIVEIMSDGKPRTTAEIVTALLDMDRVWFRNVCKCSISSKCCDLERDGVLIRTGSDCSRSSSQPYVIWGLKEAERCPEERRYRSAM